MAEEKRREEKRGVKGRRRDRHHVNLISGAENRGGE